VRQKPQRTSRIEELAAMRFQQAIVGITGGLALILVSVGPRAVAHHAFAAEFDIDQPLSLECTLTAWEMINPHSWFHIDVQNDDGEVVSWMIEGGSPNQLIRMGVTKNSVPLGTRLVIHGYRSRDGSNKAVGTDFTFPDGKRLFLGGSAPGADGPAQ
jgi:hypothetical protein